MFSRWKYLKGFLSSEESSTLRPFFSHVFSLRSEAIEAKNRENHFPCSPGDRPGNLGGLKTSLFAMFQRRFLIKQPNLLRPFDHGPIRPSGGGLLSQGPSERQMDAWREP